MCKYVRLYKVYIRFNLTQWILFLTLNPNANPRTLNKTLNLNPNPKQTLKPEPESNLKT